MSCIFKAALGDLSVISTLTGDYDEALSNFVGNATNETSLSEQALKMSERAYAVDVCYHQLVKAFFFNDYSKVLQYSEKYESYRKNEKIGELGLFTGRM